MSFVMTVEDAIETLRAAGWALSSSKGRGRIVGDVLVVAYSAGMPLYEHRVLTEPWTPAEAEPLQADGPSW